jgi:hypothetical protein
MNKRPEVFKSVLSFVIILMLVVFVLAGCTTVVPVKAKFPERPEDTAKCAELHKLDESAKLSDVSATVNDNYAEYYKCSIKVDTWNEWYENQKRIFEGIK